MKIKNGKMKKTSENKYQQYHSRNILGTCCDYEVKYWKYLLKQRKNKYRVVRSFQNLDQGLTSKSVYETD